MNKYDYDNIVTKIKILELKLKRINFRKDLLEITKPSLLEFQKRKQWKNNLKDLLIQEEDITNYLLIEYENLDKIFS